MLRRARTFGNNLKRFNLVRFYPEKQQSRGLKLSNSASSIAKSHLQEHEKKRRRIYTYFVPKRPFFRFLFFGTITAGTVLYIWQLFTPEYRSEVDPHHYYSNWKIRLYTSLPLNALSKFVGVLSRIQVPISMRESVFGVFVRAYDCRMDEAVEESLAAYPSFAAFFNRELKPEARPISSSLLVSPADGTVLHFGKVHDNRVEYVKGYDFHLHEFLGPINTDFRAGNSLYQVVIYLAPGDYHAFHSPTSWNVVEKIHHPGYLLSVRPSFLDWIPKLFCMNERIILSGNWRYGFFSMSAVAATNVGDIVIDSLPDDKKVFEDERYNVFNQHHRFEPGAKVGEFRVGSTIVLIFEAPSNLKFCIHAGDILRFGQSLVVQGF